MYRVFPPFSQCVHDGFRGNKGSDTFLSFSFTQNLGLLHNIAVDVELNFAINRLLDLDNTVFKINIFPLQGD